MRLLLFVRDPYPSTRSDLFTLFAQRLPELGISTDVVAVRHGSLATTDLTWPAGGERVVSPLPGPLGTALAGLGNDLRALLSPRGDIDAIVVRDKLLTGALALLLSKAVPVDYWMSYPIPEDDLHRARTMKGSVVRKVALWTRGRLTAWLLYSIVVPRARYVFVQSDRMRAVVSERTGRRRHVYPVPMGIDERLVPGERACTRRWRPGEPFRLAYLGSLDRVRRIDFLIDVLARLERRFPGQFQLRLIGDANQPHEMKWLREYVQASELTESVEFAGVMSRQDAWRSLASCHAGLSAIPRGEVFDVSSPTKTVEYLVLGLPVLVNDIPDQKFLVDATGAGLCTQMSVDAFVDAVVILRERFGEFANSASAARDWVIAERGYDRLALTVSNVLSARGANPVCS